MFLLVLFAKFTTFEGKTAYINPNEVSAIIESTYQDKDVTFIVLEFGQQIAVTESAKTVIKKLKDPE
jgi:hypothetical protein